MDLKVMSKSKAPKKREDGRARKEEMNQAYETLTLIDDAVHKTLTNAPVQDTVEISVTKFVNVMETFDSSSIDEFLVNEGGKRTTSMSFLTTHELMVNGQGPLENGDIHLISRLAFIHGVSKAVALTVIDKEKHKKPTLGGETKYTYLAVGIALMRSRGKGKFEATINKRDSTEARAFMFGGNMYFTLSKKFKLKDLTKYAVIIQRVEDGAVGIIDPAYPNNIAR